MSVRAKFMVYSVREFAHNAGSKEIILQPQYDETIPEDRRFYAATPSGEFRMLVNNPLALEQLIPGKQFYVDFTPVDKS